MENEEWRMERKAQNNIEKPIAFIKFVNGSTHRAREKGGKLDRMRENYKQNIKATYNREFYEICKLKKMGEQ